MIRIRNWKKIYTVLIFLVVSIPSLGSSVTFCDTGDIYNKPYDQSDEYSSRWYNGRAQHTPHWTPDGSQIVFGHAGRIYLVDADGSNLQSLSGPFEPAGLYSPTIEIDFSPSLSPDGSRVAYTTLRYASGELREHTYEIATQAIDGSYRQRLTTNDWNDVSPSWSPDGSRIAFVSYREDGPRVFTIATDGSDERSVAPSVQAQTDAPVWSPDGSRLAFVGVEREYAEIPYLDTYHSNSTPTPGPYEGEVVRFVAYTVGADGSNLTKLEWRGNRPPTQRTRIGINDLSLPEENVSPPSWSPDGDLLAFSAEFYGEAPTIYLMQKDGSTIAKIPATSIAKIIDRTRFLDVSQVTNISWSKDGSEIRLIADATFLTGRDRDLGFTESIKGLYIIQIDNSQLRAMSEIPVPCWQYRNFGEWRHWIFTPSPDDSMFAVNDSSKWNEYIDVVLYTVDIDGTNETILVNDLGARLEAGSPEWTEGTNERGLCSR